MIEIFKNDRLTGDRRVPVPIRGETGTGKEVLAAHDPLQLAGG